MKKLFGMTIMMVVLLVVAAPAPGQEAAAPQGSLAMTYVVDLLPGHQVAFEEGFKAHLAMHAEAQDPWNLETWVVVAGKNVGRYYVRSFGHTWASLDEETDIPNDQEQWNAAVMPHVQHLSSMVTEWMTNLSRWPEGPEPPKMADLTTFTVDYAHADDFFLVIKKMHQMIGDKNLPLQYSWGRVEVGGSGLQMTLAIPLSGWADFEPPKPGLWEVAEEVFGDTETEMLRSMFRDAILAEDNFVVAYRSDLSYMPEK